MEQNKAIVRRFVDEFFHQKNVAIADELCDPAFAGHGAFPFEGIEGLKGFGVNWAAGFPDWHGEFELLAEGDQVVQRWTGQGTHRGEFMGIAATDTPITMTGISIFRLASGRIVEMWSEGDTFGLLQQLGAIQGPASS